MSNFFASGKPAARARAQGAALGILLIAAGAVLLFALTASSPHVVGVILIAAGVLVLLSVLAHAMLSSSLLRTTWFSPGTRQGSEDADPDYSPGDDQNDL